MLDVELGNVFPNHQRLARAITDLRDFNGTTKRLAEEDATAAAVAMAIAGYRCLTRNWLIIVAASILRRRVVTERAELQIDPRVVDHAFVARRRHRATNHLLLLFGKLFD